MWKFGNLWAGTEDAFELACSAMRSAHAMVVEGKQPPRSELLSIQDGVGIVKIDGVLIPGEAGFLALFGAVGYDDVRNAMVEAAMNPDVKSILMSIGSGGGAVDGVADTAAVIAQVRQVKPIVSYADGLMASAAYWLGSQADQVVAGKTAQVGSIGVITKHSEASKMRKEVGITDTTVRSVENKQLVNSFEPLTPAAKEQLQETVDDMHAIFRSAVADARGMKPAQVDSASGYGRAFVGQKAVSAGLVDGIATYDGALAIAKALQPSDTQKAPRKTARSIGANMTLKKRTLSAELAAAIASGAAIPENLPAAEETPAAETPAAETPAAETPAAETPAAEQTPAEPTDGIKKGAEPAPVADSALVAFLRGELASANDKLTTNAVELAQLRAQVATVADTQPKLLEIARGAVAKMQIALGGNGAAAATMSAIDVIAAHAETSATFAEKFIVGGAASTSASTKKTDKPAASVPAPNNLFVLTARAAR